MAILTMRSHEETLPYADVKGKLKNCKNSEIARENLYY